MKQIMLSPSVISADLANLERDIKQLEAIGMDTLHVDILDGAFSPSMPLGLETVKRLREVTNLDFDVHLMSLNNEFFINELLDIGVQYLSFHYESSLHVQRYISLIKARGAKAGIALTPATSLSVLDMILPELDMVLLMLINPGFAGSKGEQQVPYATEKITALRQMIDARGLDIHIQVDGRVSLETIPALLQAGATSLVLGSTSLFIKGNTMEENKTLLDQAVALGLAK